MCVFGDWGFRLIRRGNDDVADDVSTDSKSDGRMTRVVMDGWADECMDGWVDGCFDVSLAG